MRARGIRWPDKACALLISIVVSATTFCHAAAPPGHACVRVELEAEVSSGQEWKAQLGQGWVFRILPVATTPAGYTGWDLVVDRDPPAGYPDALLLATLPYNSINQREIGTTFRLRAQDAIGWNPRSFRFLSNPAAFREAQQWFRQWTSGDFALSPNAHPRDAKTAGTDVMARLLELERHAASGQLRILDARIVPGIADPEPFALAWAQASSRTRHEIEPAPGRSSARGKLLWMRFALTLWLPAPWIVPRDLHSVRAACPE